MATVSFSYRSKKDIANIEVRFTYKEDGKRKSIYARTSYEVSKKFWEEYQKGKEFRDDEKRAKKIEITNLTHGLREYIQSESLRTFKFSSEWLGKLTRQYEYQTETTTSVPTKLLEYFDYYLYEVKRNEIVHKPTLRKWKVTIKKLERYESEKNRLFSLSEVNETFKNDFIDWSKEKQYSASTIKKDLRLIKQICLHAGTKGIDISRDLSYFKYKAEREIPIVYLSFEEIEEIKKVKDLPDYLSNARDWLIISCYTGQRVSDFMRFTPEMISSNGAMKTLEITQEKTGKQIVIPLLPEVIEILNNRGGQFPRVISDQRYNDYIKEVCRSAKINGLMLGKLACKTENGIRGVVDKYHKCDLITSHTGRRSFATNFYGKIPTAFLKELTGHGSEAMLLKYIGKKTDDLTKDIYNAMLSAIE